MVIHSTEFFCSCECIKVSASKLQKTGAYFQINRFPAFFQTKFTNDFPEKFVFWASPLHAIAWIGRACLLAEPDRLYAISFYCYSQQLPLWGLMGVFSSGNNKKDEFILSLPKD